MSDASKTDIIVAPLTFEESARAVLNANEFTALQKYIEGGGKTLAPQTISAFFELYLNGSDIAEIHRLNKAFPIEAIHWAMVRFQWPIQKEEYIRNLQYSIKDKLIKVQMETVGLLSDMLTAANKKHGDKLKKFIQTGNEQDLAGALSIDSVHGLLKVVEGIQKITGGPPQKVSKEETLNVNIQTSETEALDTESAAKILAVIAEAKRKKAQNDERR